MRGRTDLGGIKVVDLAYGTVGLYCTKLLRGLGGAVTENGNMGQGTQQEERAVSLGICLTRKRALPES